MAILTVENLKISYGAVDVVDGVSFSLEKGQTVGLVGASGSGKSTLALSILRLLPPNAVQSGVIRLDALSLGDLPEKALQKVRGKRIAMIFQEPMSALNPVIQCGQQMAEAVRLHRGCKAAEARQICLHWLTKVQITDPERVFQAYPHQLSGGQLQRVMIAMALCGEPEILIADEPTTALDVSVQKAILDLLQSLQRELGIAMILVSHDLAVIRYVSDHILVMEKGVVVEYGSSERVLNTPQSDFTRSLLQAQLHQTANSEPAARSLLLRVPPLNVRYPIGKNYLGQPAAWLTALDTEELDLFEGESLGIVGESGSGKSTLARSLLSIAGGAKAGAALISQNPHAALNPRMKVGMAIAEPMRFHQKARNAAEAKEKTRALLEAVGLGAEYMERLPHTLSGGQKQRVCIARALSIEPRLLICDEIVSALDNTVQKAILDLLADLKQRFQLTIVFISHDLSVVRYLCGRVMVMHRGRIVESGHTAAVFEAPQDAYTRELLSAQL